MKDEEVEDEELAALLSERVYTTDDASTSIVLTDLVPDTTYTITVAAITGAGEGERSELESGRTDPARKLHCTIPQAIEVQEKPDMHIRYIVHLHVHKKRTKIKAELTLHK